MLKKILLYTLIYIVISFIMSYDEIQCATSGNEMCWVSLIGKFLIFILLMLLFDRFIKPRIFKR